jgi:hypothetical protein
MSRIIPAAIITALSQPTVQPFFAVEMSFDSGAIRLWSGSIDRTIDGQIYVASGNLLSVGSVEEVSDLSAKSLSVTLNGISSDIISLALIEPYQRRPARILFGVSDVDDYIEVFSGKMNMMNIEDSGDTSTVELTIESKLIELERAKERRYTHENQKSRYPDDKFFTYVADLQDKEIVWGKLTPGFVEIFASPGMFSR